MCPGSRAATINNLASTSWVGRGRRRRLDGSAHRSANCPVNYSSVVLLSVTPFVLSRSCGLLLIIFIRIIIIINSGRETCGKSIYLSINSRGIRKNILIYLRLSQEESLCLCFCLCLWLVLKYGKMIL